MTVRRGDDDGPGGRVRRPTRPHAGCRRVGPGLDLRPNPPASTSHQGLRPAFIPVGRTAHGRDTGRYRATRENRRQQPQTGRRAHGRQRAASRQDRDRDSRLLPWPAPALRQICLIIQENQVTHNLQRTERCQDRVAFFCLGEMIDAGSAEHIFMAPKSPRTRKYVTGRFD